MLDCVATVQLVVPVLAVGFAVQTLDLVPERRDESVEGVADDHEALGAEPVGQAVHLRELGQLAAHRLDPLQGLLEPRVLLLQHYLYRLGRNFQR